ncbi:hypothetical protein ON010_g18790 [Phytophthora cinnamomi]|nr:hypothetical protein ON010_g18790 [Phytophthora cinnamomi]
MAVTFAPVSSKNFVRWSFTAPTTSALIRTRRSDFWDDNHPNFSRGNNFITFVVITDSLVRRGITALFTIARRFSSDSSSSLPLPSFSLAPSPSSFRSTDQFSSPTKANTKFASTADSADCDSPVVSNPVSVGGPPSLNHSAYRRPLLVTLEQFALPRIMDLLAELVAPAAEVDGVVGSTTGGTGALPRVELGGYHPWVSPPSYRGHQTADHGRSRLLRPGNLLPSCPPSPSSCDRCLRCGRSRNRTEPCVVGPQLRTDHPPVLQLLQVGCPGHHLGAIVDRLGDNLTDHFGDLHVGHLGVRNAGRLGGDHSVESTQTASHLDCMLLRDGPAVSSAFPPGSSG